MISPGMKNTYLIIIGFAYLKHCFLDLMLT